MCVGVCKRERHAVSDAISEIILTQLTHTHLLNSLTLTPHSFHNQNAGAGTARYWVLKLLIDNFGPGDKIVSTSVSSTPFCGVVDSHSNYGSMTLTCTDPTATITSIDFASYGTPTGSCGNYQRGTCDAANVTSVVKSACVGKNTCTFGSLSEFGDPCYKVYKTMVVQAQCSGGAGGLATPPSHGLYAQSYVNAASGAKKVLLVNRQYAPLTFTLPGATGGTLYTVDVTTGDGPASSKPVSSDSITLAEYAVAVLVV